MDIDLYRHLRRVSLRKLQNLRCVLRRDPHSFTLRACIKREQKSLAIDRLSLAATKTAAEFFEAAE